MLGDILVKLLQVFAQLQGVRVRIPANLPADDVIGIEGGDIVLHDEIGWDDQGQVRVKIFRRSCAMR